MLDMISSLHTTYGVSDLVTDKSGNHLVMAKFLSIALLQLSKFSPQPCYINRLTTITKLITQRLLICRVQIFIHLHIPEAEGWALHDYKENAKQNKHVAHVNGDNEDETQIFNSNLQKFMYFSTHWIISNWIEFNIATCSLWTTTPVTR